MSLADSHRSQRLDSYQRVDVLVCDGHRSKHQCRELRERLQMGQSIVRDRALLGQEREAKIRQVRQPAKFLDSLIRYQSMGDIERIQFTEPGDVFQVRINRQRELDPIDSVVSLESLCSP